MAAKEIFPGITSDPEIWSGKPMLKGRRIPASLVIAMMAGGTSLADLEEEFDLSEAEVRTALDYAATTLEALEEQAAAQRAEVADAHHP
jgi:uncharacterized protein (DUF433 family)